MRAMPPPSNREVQRWTPSRSEVFDQHHPSLRLIVAGEAAPAAKLAFPRGRTIMPAASSPPTRRSVLAGSAIVGAVSLLPAHLTAAAAAGDTPPGQPSNQGNSSMDTEVDNALRPFQFNAPDEALADLRRRIAATRWPDQETVADESQGVQLATMQELARYWATDYDWRKVRGEAERPAAVRHRDRRARHSFHPRSLEARRMRCRSSSRMDGPARSSSS